MSYFIKEKNNGEAGSPSTCFVLFNENDIPSLGNMDGVVCVVASCCILVVLMEAVGFFETFSHSQNVQDSATSHRLQSISTVHRLENLSLALF